MTHQARIRRMGWLAAIGICLALYAVLHVKVNSVHADVVRAEQAIVELEQQNLLLETEFLTRANQVQLAAWNRVDFGFQAPEASQFVEGPMQLAAFGTPRSADAPAPILLAGMTSEEGVPEFPELRSPLTGRPIDEAVLAGDDPDERGLAVTLTPGPLRVPMSGVTRVALVEAGAR
ncbi:hypothetical protein [Aurantiacibacter gangjinensis]|uniref:hypothetical protein n=1 Tax=Aurantiacibacter gangjinensis TaxID=502682 RepID=UPI0006993705|nr:hypothetical protein [Aurantiacibacter gangjinensis]APE27014.1 Cell division protein FtsL [Aurantiacibacter gangjinensis]